MKRTMLAIFISSAVLGACANAKKTMDAAQSVLEGHLVALENANPTNYSAAAPQGILGSEFIKASLNKNSSVIQLPDGRAYFELFELPSFEKPYHVEIPEYRFDRSRYITIAGNHGYLSICSRDVKYLAVRGIPTLYGKISAENDDGGTEYYGTGTPYYRPASTSHYFQLPGGTIRVAIPKKPIGSSMFSSGSEVTPCQRHERTLSEFIQQLSDS